MIRTVLKGINGSNPLGFMASVGLLRVLEAHGDNARLAFTDEGTFHAWIDCNSALDDIADMVSKDAEGAAGPQPWRLEYEKQETKRVKVVADLKAPPELFLRFLISAVDEWRAGRPARSDYATAYGTEVAQDGNGNTKPTALHFTAANQQFLGCVEETRRRITKDWVRDSLDDRDGKTKPGTNLRWDPDAERTRALMSIDPSKENTVVNAPLEWLAFRGLPAFPCIPIGDRAMTCGVTGRRQDELRFHWPLWSCRASYATVRSLLVLTARWIENEEKIRRKLETGGGNNNGRHSRLRLDLERSMHDRRARGVFALCTSSIRRSAQGFGNFGPSQLEG